MEISDNFINKLEQKTLKNPSFSGKKEQIQNTDNNSELPNAHSIGQSMVNSNIPVSYSKIGEINVPGLEEKASIFKLANGQKVVICPKKGLTVVKTTYNVGSLNETENIRGMSHYIEHNLFNGSKDIAPREYDKIVSDLGGGTNASTSYASTDYFVELQLLKEDSLEKAIWLNAMQTQFPTFPTDQLEKEKEPVKSEIDMYKDVPNDVACSLALKNLYNINTNSTNFIIGTKDNINSFTRDQVLDYFNTWYTPDNAVTVITGDVDVDETINLVSKYYNKKTDLSKTNQRFSEPLTSIQQPIRTDIIQPNATSPSITMCFAIPEGTSNKDRNNLDSLFSILCSSNSRMSKALDRYGINIEFFTEKMQNKPDGAEAIVLSVSPTENQIEDVLKIIYEELTYLANNPPTQEELNAIKKQSLNSLKNATEHSNRLNNILTYMVKSNDLNYFEDKKHQLEALTPQDISQLAKQYLDLNKVSICVSHEKTATNESISKNYNNVSVNRSPMLNNVSFGASINPLESLDEEINKIQQYRLPNNIEMLSIKGSPTAQSELIMDISSDELNNIPSPAFQLLNQMLERGSLFKNFDEYSRIKNSNDVDLCFHAGVDGLTISSSFNDGDINSAIALLKETLLYPNFTEAEFQRAKQLIVDSILSEEVSPMDKLFQELYPSIRKYASKEQRLQELNALTLNDIRNLYAIILQTSKVSASFTGPLVDKPYLQDVINNELSYNMPVFKPFTREDSPSYNIYSPNTEAKILTAAEEKAQADVAQAYSFKEVKNIKEIAQISLLNEILGGSMSSRLFTDLRENKKLAYSVGSATDSEKNTSAIILNIGTTTDSPDPKEGSPKNITIALKAFDDNVNLLKTQNVSDKELQDAKLQLKAMILSKMETNFSKNITFNASNMSEYGINYYREYLKVIDSITADDIRAAANYVFKNPPITSIVASQKTLDALNL